MEILQYIINTQQIYKQLAFLIITHLSFYEVATVDGVTHYLYAQYGTTHPVYSGNEWSSS